MKNKNKNIAKFFSEKLPDPEIPADDAWGNMNDMLNANAAGGNARHVFKGGKFKLLSGLILGGIVSIGLVLFLNDGKKEVSIKLEKASDREVISAAEKKNKEIEKIGKTDKIQEDFKTKINVETERNANSKGREKIERTERNKENGEIEKIEISEQIETVVTTKRDFKTDKVEIIAKYPGKNNLLTETPGNISKSAKPTGESNMNVSKSANRENVAGKRDEQFAMNAIKKRTANESSGKINTATERNKRSEAAALSQLKSLRFKPKLYDPGFSAKVKSISKPNGEMTRNIPKQSREKSFEIGLEWNLISPLKQTDYLFTGIDSVKKPVLLLIPGIYLTQAFNENHLVTLSLSANQPYFGNSGKLTQVLDSLPGRDSLFSSRGTNLIKTVGINLALQYQYQFVNHFTFGAGIAYSRISGALVQKRVYHGSDEPPHQELVTLKTSEDIGSSLSKNVFYVKAGVSYKIGRLHTGVNILAPVSNVSASPKFPIRAVNGQFFLRFRVWQKDER